MIRAEFQIADTKVIRTRGVYNIITLISEVSGFADIFYVGIGFILATFYTPFLLEAALHSHMGPCATSKITRVIRDPTTDKTGLYDMILDIKSRFEFKLSLWAIIASKIIPDRWKSPKAKNFFDLINKN